MNRQAPRFKRWLKIALCLAVPVALYVVAANRLSWRTRVLRHNVGIWYVTFSKDGDALLTIDQSEVLRRWDVAWGRLHWSRRLGGPTKSVLFAGGSDGRDVKDDWLPITLTDYRKPGATVQMWDMKTGQLRRTQRTTTQATDMIHSPTDHVAVIVRQQQGSFPGDPAHLTLWDTKRWRAVGDLEGDLPQRVHGVHCMNISENGKRLLAGVHCYGEKGKSSRELRLWSLKTRKLLHRYRFNVDYDITAATFSTDGELIVGCCNQTVNVWSTTSGRLLHTLRGHSDAVVDGVFAPDDTLLATASFDGTAKLWDAETGQCLRTLHGHSGPVGSVTFAPDGRTLATAGEDGTVRLWRIK